MDEKYETIVHTAAEMKSSTTSDHLDVGGRMTPRVVAPFNAIIMRKGVDMAPGQQVVLRKETYPRVWLVRRGLIGAVLVGASFILLPVGSASGNPVKPPQAAVTTNHLAERYTSDTEAKAQADRERLARSLFAEVGPSRSGGSYIDLDHRVVVTVLDQLGVRHVKDNGAIPRIVAFSDSHLSRIMAILDSE